jgi:hypothetical protein
MSLSACVTRILSLNGFPAELKTRDIQAAFAEYENEKGGFKIKWIDDTSLLIVFNDAAVGEYCFLLSEMFTWKADQSESAKKAYLQTLVNPPPQFISPTSDKPVCLRPYDGPDAQNVITAVNSRANGHRARPSVSGSSGNILNSLGGVPIAAVSGVSSVTAAGGHARTNSRAWKKASNGNISIDPSFVSNSNNSPLAREPSPSLPNLPAHPTLGALISSSLSDLSPHDTKVAS